MPYTLGPGEHRIHFRELGAASRPTIVLIQGLTLDGRFWFDLPQRLAKDPEHPWHVLVPDNRGVGLSDLPGRPWTMADMADDVAAMLDAVDVRQAVVVGISMGGMIAQQVALRHPERVAGLILMATWPGLPYGKLPPLRSLGDLVGSSVVQRGNMDAVARLILPDSRRDDARELLRGWFGLMRERPPQRQAVLGQLGAIASHSTGHRLGRIQAPTRVITGAEDRLIPPINAERLAARIPGAGLEIVPDVAHAIPLLDRSVVHRNLAALGMWG
ncbi:alpha/beta fold hydrolase [Pseudenhygromyxa sp. WMMC2535]|uniref:alpha/beta fold hydrolase n=1 Tax=Pseudenhygromyxa sp. WMMC2535 TaxID=2712867 RepID=UPI001554A953|nr:alpha/beta fold hydrolase [Pseudenhygromyxa sp. WMMC2535]